MGYIGLFNIQPDPEVGSFGSGNIYTSLTEINSLSYADSIHKIIEQAQKEGNFVAPIVVDNLNIVEDQTFQGAEGVCIEAKVWGDSLAQNSSTEVAVADITGTLKYNVFTKDVYLTSVGMNWLDYLVPGKSALTIGGLSGSFPVTEVLSSNVAIVTKGSNLALNLGVYETASFSANMVFTTNEFIGDYLLDSAGTLFEITANTLNTLTLSNSSGASIALGPWLIIDDNNVIQGV